MKNRVKGKFVISHLIVPHNYRVTQYKKYLGAGVAGMEPSLLKMRKWLDSHVVVTKQIN